MANLINKFIGAVRGLASDVQSKLSDNSGLFQNNKFVPIRAAQQSITNWATQNPVKATQIVQAPQFIKTKVSPIVNQFSQNVMKDWNNIKTNKIDWNKINSQPSFVPAIINQGIKSNIIPTKTYQSGMNKVQGIDYEKILNKATNMGLGLIPGMSTVMSMYKQGTQPLDILQSEDKVVSDNLGKLNPNLPTVYNAAKLFVPGYFQYQVAKEIANAPGNVNAILTDPQLDTPHKAAKMLYQEVIPLLAYKYAPEIAKTIIPEPTHRVINSILGPVFVKTPGLMNLFIRAAARGGSQILLVNTALEIRKGLQENKDLKAIVANIIQTAPATFAGGALFGLASEGVNTLDGGRSAAANFNKTRNKTVGDTVDFINQRNSKITTNPAEVPVGPPMLPEQVTPPSVIPQPVVIPQQPIITPPPQQAAVVPPTPQPIPTPISKIPAPIAKKIVSQEPIINTKRDVPVKDIYGNKVVLPAGDAFTPFKTSDNKVVLQDDIRVILNKSQYQNVKGNSITATKPNEFASELKQTGETIKTLTGEPSIDELNKLSQKDYGLNWNELDVQGQRSTVMGDYHALARENGPKYHQYTLPGGNNYREILIQAPKNIASSTIESIKPLPQGGYRVSWTGGFRQNYLHATSPEEAKQFALEQQKAGLVADNNNFGSAHWNEPNVLSHLRVNDRVTPDGKKVTFMEEMQSDWAATGRREGFASGTTPTLEEYFKPGNIVKSYAGYDKVIAFHPATEANGRNWSVDVKAVYHDGSPIQGAQVRNHSTYPQDIKPKGVPNNPLLKNWEEMTIKRALQEAVNNNSEYLSWTTGEQQAARYNLSKQVDNIEWDPVVVNGEMGKNVDIQPKSGDLISISVDKNGIIFNAGQVPQGWAGKKIADVIGKGIGEKILKSEKGMLSGEGLNIGGEWAKNLYDKQIKNIVEDLTGGKVQVMDLGLPTTKDNAPWFQTQYNKQDQAWDMIKIEDGKEIKTGMLVTQRLSTNPEDAMVVVDTLDDGTFEAVPLSATRPYVKGDYGPVAEGLTKRVPEANLRYKPSAIIQSDTFVKTTSNQQVLKITPEVRARVLGEVPSLEQPSGYVPPYGKEARLSTNVAETGLAQPPVQETALVGPPVVESFYKNIQPVVDKFGLSVYNVSDYNNFKVGLSTDKNTGYAIKPDGDLISVFNTGPKGNGKYAVIEGIENGATKLDCYDSKLVPYYKQFGFEEYKREANWTPGGPDVVYLQLNPVKYEQFKASHPAYYQTAITDTSGQSRPVFERNFRPIGQRSTSVGEGNLQNTPNATAVPTQEVTYPTPPEPLLPGQKERGLITSTKENLSVEPGIREQVGGNYDMTTDEGRIQYAQELYVKDPVGTLNKALSEQSISPEASGISYVVFHDLQKKAYDSKHSGNMAEYVSYRDQATKVMEQWAKRLTPGAQEIQFAHLMSYSDPMEMVDFIKDIYTQSNEVSNMNLSRILVKITGGKENKWKLGVTPEMEQEILNTMKEINIMPSGPEKDKATQDLMIEMMKPIPYPLRMLIDAYRYQNMLSGLRTHLKNTYGNTFQAYVLYPTHMLDMAAWDMITGNPNPKYKFSDIPAHYRSMFGSMKLAQDNFMNKLRNPTMQLGKNEDFNQTTFNQMMLGKTPKALTITGRLLEAEDGFFTTIIGNSHYAYLKSKGVEETQARASAQKMAEYLLFRDKLHPEGQAWFLRQLDSLTKWINAGRGKFAPLNWFIPFINVMMRITKQNFEYLPLTSWATTLGSSDKAVQFSKLRIGLFISLLGAIAAMTGNSTWGVPTDPKEKAAFYDAGHKPYTFNVFGLDVPIWFLGPWAMAFGMVPAFKQHFEDSKTSLTDSFLQKSGKSLLDILNFIAQSTPLAGLGGFVRTMQGDIDFSVINNISFTATQMVPLRGLLSDISKMIDPVFRKSKGLIQTVQSGIPFWSKGLPAYINTTTGEESKRNISDYVSPYSVGKVDPILDQNYKNLIKTNQLRSEANVYKKMADEAVGGTPAPTSTTSTSEKNLKANLTNINTLLDSYTNITDEKIRAKIQTAVEKYGVNFSDAYENYLTKDVAVHQKGLTKESQATLQRSKEFTYVRKLRDLYDGTGVGGDFLAQELAKKNIKPEDLVYDDQTALPDDVQLEEIKNSIATLSGSELSRTLISYRRISEGTRKALLTDTLITKLNKEGIINDDTSAFLKTIVWDSKTRQPKVVPGKSKKPSFSKIAVPAFRSSTGKKITIKPLKLPKISTGSTASSNYAKIIAKMPKVTTRTYTPAASKIKINMRRPVTLIRNLGGIA